jgi:DNA-binding transcriptional MerR regulator
MDEDTSTTRETYKTSEAARELGISAEWLRKGEERGFFPPARRDPLSGHRYYTSSDIERLRQSRRTGRHHRG